MKPVVQQRSQATRDRVLEAAEALILESGHGGVSLKDVQERSGVSNGSIFHHFGSRDGILRELFMAEQKRYLGGVAQAIISYEGDPCEAFGAGVRAALDYHQNHPDRYARLIAEFAQSEWLRSHQDTWLSVAKVVEQPVLEWAVEHFAAGRLPMMPPPLFQALMLGPAEVSTRAWLQGRLSSEPSANADTLAEMLVSGLKQMRERQAAQARSAE